MGTLTGVGEGRESESEPPKLWAHWSKSSWSPPPIYWNWRGKSAIKQRFGKTRSLEMSTNTGEGWEVSDLIKLPIYYDNALLPINTSLQIWPLHHQGWVSSLDTGGYCGVVGCAKRGRSMRVNGREQKNEGVPVGWGVVAKHLWGGLGVASDQSGWLARSSEFWNKYYNVILEMQGKIMLLISITIIKAHTYQRKKQIRLLVEI